MKKTKKYIKADRGIKVDRPTQQDSLDLYNNTKQVDDFYNKSGKYKRDIAMEEYNSSQFNRNIKNYNKENDSAYFQFQRSQDLDNIKTATNTGERPLKKGEYRKEVDKNRYYQRELANGVLNMDAPMQLFDRRITPQYPRNYSYKNNSKSDPLSGDEVRVNMYDPIAVKPWNMLTKEERSERVKKYGSPKSDKPIRKKDHINKVPPTPDEDIPGFPEIINMQGTKEHDYPIDLPKVGIDTNRPTYTGPQGQVYMEPGDPKYVTKGSRGSGKNGIKIKKPKYIKKADNGIDIPLDPNNSYGRQPIPSEVENGQKNTMANIDPSTQRPLPPNLGLPGVTPATIDQYHPQHPLSSTPTRTGKPRNFSFDNSGVMAGIVQGIDALIPQPIPKDNQTKLISAYNPYPQGTNSGATFQNGGQLGTKLSKEEESKYNKWKTTLPKNLQYEGDYDLRGFYKENPKFNAKDPNQHMTDRYKLPNHPTFSNESMYFNESNKGNAGHWDDSMYVPYDPSVKDTLIDNSEQGEPMYRLKNGKKQPILKEGGYIPQGKDGLSVEDNQVSKIGPNDVTGDTVKFNGPSHKEGGIDINFNNQNVEVEGNETGFVDRSGSFNVLGNLKVPGTNTKFKKVGEDIAKHEMKNKKMEKRGSYLINNNRPHVDYESFSFNTGKVLQDAALQNEVMYADTKEQLAQVQNGILEHAERTGVEPKEIVKNMKTAKYGIKIKADNGTKVEQEQMLKEHPDLVKEALDKYGQPKTGRFDDGLEGPRTSYVRNYVKTNSNRNTNLFAPPKDWNPSDIPNDNISPIEPLVNKELPTSPHQVTNGPNPDNDYVDPMVERNDIPGLPSITKDAKSVNVKDPLHYRNFRNKLGISDVLPEIAAMLDQQKPVPIQQFNPTLETPYKVSFEDQVNANSSDFNAAQSTLSHNPAALGALNAQKYDQNSKVLGEEFRVNQGIESQVNNTNVGMINKAKEINMQSADQQMVRQAQAYENTRANRLAGAESLSDKIAKNRSENANIKLYEDLYHYGYTPEGFKHEGDPTLITTPGVGTADLSPKERTKRYKHNSKGESEEVDTEKESYYGTKMMMGGMAGMKGVLAFRGMGSGDTKKKKKYTQRKKAHSF